MLRFFLILVLLSVLQAQAAPLSKVQSTSSTVPSASAPSLPSVVAAFTYNPCTLCVVPGDLVFFNASYSIAVTRSIAQYTWNFGDGSQPVQTTDPYTSHDYYGYPGKWTVTLTVTTSDGSTDRLSQLVVFNVAPRFTFHPRIGIVGRPVLFNASTSISYVAGIGEYLWGFGDGSTGSGPMATHAYSLPGIYRVNLTLVTTDGNPTVSKTLVVWKNPDVNGDGTVALDDLLAVWTHQFASDPQYDLDGDGSCDSTDLIFVYLNQFQTF